MEMTFKEIVKLIHPDSNPNIQGASEKMSIVVRNRGDVKSLWNLAVRWSLVSGVENTNVNVFSGQTTIRLNTYGWDTGIREDHEAEMREFRQRMRAERDRRFRESQRRSTYSGWEVPNT